MVTRISYLVIYLVMSCKWIMCPRVLWSLYFFEWKINMLCTLRGSHPNLLAFSIFIQNFHFVLFVLSMLQFPSLSSNGNAVHDFWGFIAIRIKVLILIPLSYIYVNGVTRKKYIWYEVLKEVMINSRQQNKKNCSTVGVFLLGSTIKFIFISFCHDTSSIYYALK